MLEESAYELFLENGYTKTSVEQITQRAGVSRNTFFNYFAAKSDVFWGALDTAAALLRDQLAARPDAEPAFTALERALVETAAQYGPARVPWILTQHEQLGSSSELYTASLPRFDAIAQIFHSFLADRTTESPEHLRTLSYALVGTIIGAAREWADAGQNRGDLSPYVERSVRPLLHAFSSAG